MLDSLRLFTRRLVSLYDILRHRGDYSNQERNIALLYLEVAVVSLLSAAASFNSAFALRLGASNSLIGLMTSIPALITMLGMIPASAIIERQVRRWPMMLKSLNITRILFFPFVLIPLLVPQAFQAAAFAGLVMFRFIPLLIFSSGWDTVLADVVPPRLRSQVFSWRNILNTAGLVLTLLLIQPWLERASFPLNYQVVFLFGGIGGMLSMYFLYQMKVPESGPLVPKEKSKLFDLSLLKESKTANPQYLRFVLNTVLANAGAYLASPLYVIFYVRQLNASDGWIATLTLVSNFASMLGYFFWRRLLPRFGESRILKVTWPVTGLLPLLIGMSGSLNLVLLIVFLQSLVAPGLNLSHYNTLLEVCPKERRPTYISIYSTLMNACAFVLPMLGIAMAEKISTGLTLIISGVLWIVGGVLFTLHPVRVADVSKVRA